MLLDAPLNAGRSGDYHENCPSGHRPLSITTFEAGALKELQILDPLRTSAEPIRTQCMLSLQITI